MGEEKMTLQQLKYVTEVADRGSISETAKALFIAQPSLSAAIRDLEEETGITIFLRNSRGILITPDGQEFLGYARQVVQQAALIEDKYIAHSQPRQRFAVSTQHYSFTSSAFVELVHDYAGSSYEFILREGRTYDTILDVSRLRSDLGVIYLSGFNEAVLNKQLKDHQLNFHELLAARPQVLGLTGRLGIPDAWFGYYSMLPGILIVPIVAGVPLGLRVHRTQPGASGGFIKNAFPLFFISLGVAMLQFAVGFAVHALFGGAYDFYDQFGIELGVGDSFASIQELLGEELSPPTSVVSRLSNKDVIVYHYHNMELEVDDDTISGIEITGAPSEDGENEPQLCTGVKLGSGIDSVFASYGNGQPINDDTLMYCDGYIKLAVSLPGNIVSDIQISFL